MSSLVPCRLLGSLARVCGLPTGRSMLCARTCWQHVGLDTSQQVVVDDVAAEDLAENLESLLHSLDAEDGKLSEIPSNVAGEAGPA